MSKDRMYQLAVSNLILAVECILTSRSSAAMSGVVGVVVLSVEEGYRDNISSDSTVYQELSADQITVLFQSKDIAKQSLFLSMRTALSERVKLHRVYQTLLQILRYEPIGSVDNARQAEEFVTDLVKAIRVYGYEMNQHFERDYEQDYVIGLFSSIVRNYLAMDET